VLRCHLRPLRLRGVVAIVSVQPNLLGETPPPKLGVAQTFLLDQVTARGGLTADEAGALLCERRGHHPADSRCRFCVQNGRQVLGSLRAKGLLTRKRGSGLWVPKGWRPEVAESAQTDVIPW
jgi:hypothetical protein